MGLTNTHELELEYAPDELELGGSATVKLDNKKGRPFRSGP